MLTLVITITFLGFFILYNTSEKAVLTQSLFLEKWVQNNHLPSKFLGYTLLLIAFIISIPLFGIGAGISLYLTILMTVASVVILLAPLHYITYKTLSAIFIISFIVELIFC
ncbi:hypothetical protein APR41_17830 [Salegentibacter salinarum]|uniref:Uncharacterized protein n=1 Tax=Salegentibacter salinarum TaxID=447422 RepID=A0A2N0TVC2_9FLAO|nr:hypothetical protein APR41_17830 [Salegentibacter salinarum]SKB99041.1 hypothetical protein SAMN05660903_03675 [Salegentibacter salinarum]